MTSSSSYCGAKRPVGVEHRAHGAQLDRGRGGRRRGTRFGPRRVTNRTPSLLRLLELLVPLRRAQHGHLVEVLERDDRHFGGAAAKRRARGIERFLRARVGLAGERVDVLVAADAQRRARRIERDEAAADDDDAAAEIHPVAAVDVQQVVDGLDDAVELDAGHLQIAAARHADREEHRLEAVARADAAGRTPAVSGVFELERDAEREDLVDLGAQEACAAAGIRGCRTASCRRARPPASKTVTS